jgi:hypothetical protein
MDLFFYIGCFILAIFSALPVIIIRAFKKANKFKLFDILTLVIELIFLCLMVFTGYFYFIFNNIAMADFYPIVKIIELIIPVVISIIIYKDHILPINYIGIVLAIIAIFCIGWN